MATGASGGQPSVLSTLPKDLPLDFLKTITDQFSQSVYSVQAHLELFICGYIAPEYLYKGETPPSQTYIVWAY
ncbi:unnamed protein product [Triticum turgidum subsp. durum]|uniref:Uncharacterized protein n=1 Tax=Triticum turgidum subsp. durum TaxID=4567 RepID=A0A9R1Q718_TRITD|nr:unnamed protein product [Triticum turgidum subsp. durum]